jgi:hypothetical protein
MTKEDDLTDMARRSYGYGEWKAPFWFIGPEQGKGSQESNDNQERLAAWIRMGRPEVCDCYLFHQEIHETRWHGKIPKLQATWKSLILLLLTYHGRSPTNDERRLYQSSQWGRSGGETCVIELSGLAARSLQEPIDRLQFRKERIEFIRKSIESANPKPKFVIMYGKSEEESWNQIVSQVMRKDEPVRIGSTVFLFASHPQEHGLRNEYWIGLGKRLREAVNAANI